MSNGLLKKGLNSLLLCVFCPLVANAENNPFIDDYGRVYPGPFRGKVVVVVDADTINVQIDLWPGSLQTASIRVRNVDAPETRTSCAEEKELGLEAKAWVERRYPVGDIVRVENVSPDPFYGRYVADIRRWRSDRWLLLEKELNEAGFAEPWQPGWDEIDWCTIAKNRAAE